MGFDWVVFSSIATSVGVVVGLFGAWFGVRRFSQELQNVETQLQTQVLLEYTRRYNEVMEKFPAEIRRMGFHNAPADEGRKTENLVPFLLYVNLCSEEYYLHKQGMVDDQAWKVWEREMEANLTSDFGKTAWHILKEAGHYASYGEFTGHVDQLQASGGSSG